MPQGFTINKSIVNNYVHIDISKTLDVKCPYCAIDYKQRATCFSKNRISTRLLQEEFKAANLMYEHSISFLEGTEEVFGTERRLWGRLVCNHCKKTIEPDQYKVWSSILQKDENYRCFFYGQIKTNDQSIIEHADKDLKNLLHFMIEQMDPSQMLKNWFKEHYEIYINSDVWNEKRQACFKRDGFICQKCGSAKNLVCHHLNYEHLGDEPLDDLLTLCRSCHNSIHQVDNFKKKYIKGGRGRRCRTA